MRVRCRLACLSLLCAVSGCEPRTLSISLASPAFASGAAIPKKHAGDGDNVSPALSWSGVPSGARELAMLCEDHDAPTSTPFVHWMLAKLPAASAGLPEGSGGEAVVGANDFGAAKYAGPEPPKPQLSPSAFDITASWLRAGTISF